MSAPDRSEFDAEAWRWVLRMDRPDWGPADEGDLQLWLDADERHPGALLEAEAMWEALDCVADHDAQATPRADDEEFAGPRRFGRRAILASGAATVAASVAGGMFLLGTAEHYETQVGEIRRVPLADGSTVAINTASKIEVALADKKRQVRLDRGEAWFQVAKDKARPFVVEAGRIRVQAVGTAFSVRRLASGADIVVTEGVVEAWADGADGNKVRLRAGQRAFVADNAAIARQPATTASVDRSLAWRSGKIDFVDQPIADAIAEFNRYNRRQLVVGDPALGRERFDGVFRTDDPEGFANAIRDSLGVAVDMSNPDRIRIGGAK